MLIDPEDLKKFEKPSIADFVKWLPTSKRGDSFVYWVGPIMGQRELSFFVYDCAMAGDVILVQQRLANSRFAYIARKL